MTFPSPKIVVTLPGRTIEEVARQARVAREAGADAAELRVDRLSSTDQGRVDILFPSEVPLVATYRSAAEGGEGLNEATARAPILLGLASRPFRWIDLELARDLGLLAHLPPPERLGRIVSCHLSGASATEWPARLAELERQDGIGKLVVPASVGETLRELAPQASRVGEDVVVHTVGPSGPLLRAWARRFGFPLVYAALPGGPASEPVEPSQIPVDRLRPYLDADELPPLFAVAGRPVAHSRSPTLHADWMRQDGHRGLYVALEFQDTQEFVDAWTPLAEGGLRGMNVTRPFKAAAMGAATELGPGAVACGAANCLTFRNGEVAAENTDLVAVLRRLEELRAAGRWDGSSLAILGAGGAARATLAAARELRVAAKVFARRPAQAEELASRFGAQVGEAGQGPPASLLVHATDVGRAPEARLEIPLGPLVSAGGHVLDWVYAPASSFVQRAAESASATYEDGWRLLVYQAAASYEIWWGNAPDEASVARKVVEGPCAG
jgi:shikimate dehydrogenase/3-dehydroquinate dehydratase type I